MKGLVFAGLALGTVLGLGSPALAQSKGSKGKDGAAKSGWLSTLEEGKSQARTSGKPLMVVMRCVP